MTKHKAINHSVPWLLVFVLGTPGTLTATQVPARGDWASVRGIAKAAKIEVQPHDAPRLRGRLVEVTDDSIAISAKNGDRVFSRGEVRRIRVQDGRRRSLHGLIGVGAGAGGAYLPARIASNEGRRGLATAIVAIGVGVGSLAFLSRGYRTIYHAPEQTEAPTERSDPSRQAGDTTTSPVDWE